MTLIRCCDTNNNVMRRLVSAISIKGWELTEIKVILF